MSGILSESKGGPSRVVGGRMDQAQTAWSIYGRFEIMKESYDLISLVIDAIPVEGVESEIPLQLKRQKRAEIRGTDCVDDEAPLDESGGPSLCLDAFSIALDQTDSQWYTSTLHLQLASLQFCILCRTVPRWHLIVKDGVNTRVWMNAPACDRKVKPRFTRVPTFRLRKLTWQLPESQFSEYSNKLLANVEQLLLEGLPVRKWTGMSPRWSWQKSLPAKMLEDGVYMDITKFELLASLLQMTFGTKFNQSIDMVAWPSLLQQLTFGEEFNQEIHKVAWPASLLQLTFGVNFNQAVYKVAWPKSLQELTFGKYFDQEIHEVKWPASLRKLTFGVNFNQAVHEVSWPKSLQELTFGEQFNQPIHEVAWPASLQQLTFGEEFNQVIHKMAWPASLQKLTFRKKFNQPIHKVVWPASLQQLTFGEQFDQSIHEVAWPASLQQLTFGDRFNQVIHEVAWSATLQELSFGRKFNHPIHEVVWPASLRKVTFGRNFKQAVDGVVWPVTLQELSFGKKCIYIIDGAA